MFKNYLKIAWRNLGKSKLHSFINIIGLSIGMTVAVLIGLWIHDEISFDRNFKNYDRIAKVIQNVTNNGEVQTWTSVPWPLADELRKNYGSDFKHIAMGFNIGDHLLTIEDKKLKKTGGFFEKEAPELFGIEIVRGNNKLDDPSSLLLSESAAKAYFGDADPINKLMKIDNQFNVKVTGVYKDISHNSTFADLSFISTWDLVYNNTDWIRTMEDPWRPNAFTLFVQINDNTDFATVSTKIKDAKLKKVNEQLAKKKPQLFLQPMNNWHLRSEFKNGVNVGGSIQYVWMFGIIGAFVLLLACINFMNLSTARSEKRAKEVGIRKTVGSLRKQLVVQFFSESLLTVILSFLLSLLFVRLLLPFFNEVADKQMSILWSNPYFWIVSAAFILFTALVAGSYPAFYLSSFRPIKVLKGTFKAGRFAALPRKALVIVQFTVSVILIIGTIIVYKQIQFAKSRPIGYTRQGLITLPLNTELHKHFNAMRDELIQSGAIVSIAEAGSPTTSTWSSTSGISWKGKDPNQSVDFLNVGTSYDYGKTVGWQIKEGRDFSRDFATDTSAVILNEAAVNFMGLKNPIGETITWWDQQLTVVGVIHNMVMNSPYDEPKPTVFGLSTDEQNITIAKINPASNVKDALAKIETVYKKFEKDQPFEYHFADEEYAKKFQSEERVGKLASFFAMLAIVISCLGLFGLSSFVAAQRTKEIGVRKVLGASVFGVWNLLSKDFVKLVFISFVVAVPVAWYMMNTWLQSYNYRITISWNIFLLSGLGAIAIALITVSFQSIKAAIANPVKSLRTE
ncbi:MAG TPA: ABC transporter permease [Chitinophagaceae bacterium]|jgi:ABC-type antimicrobial peptide transport system permease subunit|nr:ABC transporter permease [Chitinophagaceae bacterium]